MLGSFNKSFREKTKFQVSVPKTIIKSLSKDLPEGFGYYEVQRGVCALKIPADAKVDGEITIKNATEDNLRKCESYDDFFFYATNLQEKLIIGPKGDGKIYIDGKAFLLKDMIVAPYEEIEVINGGICVSVPKLDRVLNLDVSIGDKHYELKMKRTIFDSMDHCKFISTNYPALSVAIIGKADATDVSISAKVDFNDIASAKDICDAIELYNGFVKGKAKINGTLVSRKSFAQEGYDEDVVGFWKSIVKLEEIFNVSFNVASNHLDVEDVEVIRQLSSSLIRGVPYRARERFASISGDYTDEIDNTLKKDIGKKLVFQYVQRISGTLLGAKIEFYRLSFLFDTKISRFETSDNDSRFTVYFDSAEPEGYYQVNMEFLDEDSIEAYLNSSAYTIEMFAKAEKISSIPFVY